MQEYDIVKVVKLTQPDRQYDGTASVMREPRIGDTGTIVSILSDTGVYVVECVHPNGATVWLADFLSEELELDR